MQRIILIIPDLFGAPGDDSFLQGRKGIFSDWSTKGQKFRLGSLRESPNPEFAYFGINPRGYHLSAGVLIVSALGFDPPDSSVHFRLDLHSLTVDGKIQPAPSDITTEELAEISGLLKKLDTHKITVLKGEDYRQGLVWEDGPQNLFCPSPEEYFNSDFGAVLPVGEGESTLRRIMDDSVNLLGETDLNKRRVDEGKSSVNLVIPWGNGVRTPLPNQLIRTGPVDVISVDLSMCGIARLIGYRCKPIHHLGRGLHVSFESLFEQQKNSQCSVTLFKGFSQLRRDNKLDEMDWLWDQMGSRYWSPLFELWLKKETSVTLLSPSSLQESESAAGMCISWLPDSIEESNFPFDERALDERKIRKLEVHDIVAESIRGQK